MVCVQNLQIPHRPLALDIQFNVILTSSSGLRATITLHISCLGSNKTHHTSTRLSDDAGDFLIKATSSDVLSWTGREVQMSKSASKSVTIHLIGDFKRPVKDTAERAITIK